MTSCFYASLRLVPLSTLFAIYYVVYHLLLAVVAVGLVGLGANRKRFQRELLLVLVVMYWYPILEYESQRKVLRGGHASRRYRRITDVRG